MKPLLAGVALIAVAAPTYAAEEVPPVSSAETVAPDAPPPSTDIIVTAPFARSRQDLLSGVAVLSGADLTRQLRPTIGETLARTPGVSATSFGPAASRPILRGLQGERVRVLTDGIGSFDVSNTSVDHPVVINPLLAERVEVLRGPAALLYGSSAIGGVVNVIDRRIPRALPTHDFHLDAIGSFGSAATERSGGASVDARVGQQFVVHADGSYLKSGDLRIGGYALSPALRRQATATAVAGGDPDDPGIDFAANAAVKDRLPNSAVRTWDAALGASLITANGSYGFSVTRYDSLYGIPVRYATQAGQEQEAPRLDVKQTRLDARAEVNVAGPVIDTIRFRYGAARYRHFELEDDGSVGTAFYAQGMEGRLELAQAKHGAWKGAVGGQFVIRDFNVVGEEAFVPRNETEQYGVFTLQQLDFGALKAEAGVRLEHSRMAAKPDADQPQFVNLARAFDTLSGSAGASYALAHGWRIGINLSHSERAPSAEELFANGPHAGTEAFESGDPLLRKERSNGVEAVLRGSGAAYSLEASAFYSRFSNYVDQYQTGGSEDGLPVYQIAQGPARYYGFEVQGSTTLARFGDTNLNLDGLADYVRASAIGSGPVPRIPPLRLLGGIEAQGGPIFGRTEVEWARRQDRVAAFETPTPSYTLVNASIGFRPFADRRGTSIVLSANNLFDVTARRHASFLKDYAPLAGRDIRITAHFEL